MLTMSENSKRQKLSPVDVDGANEEDSFSFLPDTLLLHILSFLPAHEVVKTIVLSKRWSCLWASVLSLDFDSGCCRAGNPLHFVTFVNTYLLLYEGVKIERFCASFDAQFVHHVCVDSWINFLMKRGIEEIDMDCSVSWWMKGRKINSQKYVICNSLFNCKMLKVLRVIHCDIDFAACFPFKVLRKVQLERVDFCNLDLSCCPLLEFLTVRYCNQCATLNINAPSTKLKFLEIADTFVARESKLVLNAPHVLVIRILENLRQQYDIDELLFLRKASVMVYTFMHIRYEDELKKLIGLFKCFQHAETFVLSKACTEAWAYSIMLKFDSPCIKAVSLQVETDLSRLDHWILLHVLRNLPFLETLILNVCSKWEYSAGLPAETYQTRKLTWKFLMIIAAQYAKGIRNIKINNFLRRKVFCNCRYTEGEPLSNKAEFAKLVKDEEMKPVKLWLKCCSKLEEMIITVKEVKYIHQSLLKSEFFLYLSSRVQCFPRASKIARISVS